MNTAAKLADDYLGKKPTSTSTTANKSSTEKMRAIVYKGKKQMACEWVAKPVITDETDVIVKIKATTICSGSDSHLFSGELPGVDKDFIVGHEACGIVEAVGSKVKNFAPNDSVVICFNIACGTCEYCKRGEFSGCATTNDSKLMEESYGHCNSGIFGYGRLLSNYQGLQAEYARVPFGDVNLYKIPESVSFDKAVFVSDIVSTAYHAFEQCAFKKGKSVVIWGLGPIGLCCARWAQILGASEIVAIEPVKERCELARQKLGIKVINPEDLPPNVEKVTDAIFEILPEGADCCIEAAGFRFSTTTKHKVERKLGLETDTSDLVNECMYVVKKYGHVSLIADYLGYTNHFFIGAIQLKHLTISGGQTPCQRIFPIVMPYIESGEFDPSFLVTHKIGFADMPQAYENLFYKRDGWVKILVDL